MANPLGLAEKLKKEGEKTMRFFAALPDEIWVQQLYTDGAEWSVHQVLAHIVETEDALNKLFRYIVNSGGGVGEDFDIDRYNASAVEKMSGYSRQQLIDMFEQRRSAMVEFVSDLSAPDLEKEGRHPFLGHTTLGEMLRLFYLHVNLHIRDVRRLLR